MTSVEEIYKEMKQILFSIRTDIAVNPGTVTSDSVLSPVSYIMYKERVNLEFVFAMQALALIRELLLNQTALEEIANIRNITIDELKDVISDFLDKIGENYGVFRDPQTTATGFEFFGRIDPLTSNITIPSGTEVKTLDEKYYKTTADVTMFVTGSYYDPESNLYIIQAPIEASSDGIEGNTAIGTITSLITAIAGITSVFNKENVENGKDEESDLDFIDRLQAVLSGHNYGTKVGYKRMVLDNFSNVKDVYVAGPGDALMIRDQGFSGMLDLWILLDDDNKRTQVSQFVNAYNIKHGVYDGVLLDYNPTYSDGLIVDPTTVGVMNKDTTSGIFNSFAERSYVWFNQLPVPPGLSFTIEYEYDDQIEEIQNFVNLDDNAILGTIKDKAYAFRFTVLVRKAIRKNINIGATITVLSGFDANTVIADTQNNILNYINALKLGDPLAQSDIINVIEDTAGVNFVQLPLSTFNFVGSSGEVDLLEVKSNEYIRGLNIIIGV